MKDMFNKRPKYHFVDDIHHIISGAGSKVSAARKGDTAGFAFSGFGFVAVDFYDDGSVWAEFYTVDEPYNMYNPIFRVQLEEPDVNLGEILLNEPIQFPDTVKTIADDRYDISGFGQMMLGREWRNLWSAPVEYPVLNMRTEKGGLKIFGISGGMQTTTVFLENPEGRRYVMRSVPKDPIEVVPEIARQTFIADIVRDALSASNPYGPVAIPPIAKAAGIYYNSPEIIYMPDDPALGIYREILADTPMMMEEFINVDFIKEKFGDEPESINSTEDLMEILFENPDQKVDPEWMLRSRLVDMIIADWDRHEGQYFWLALKQEDDSIIHRPFPFDRDGAMFRVDGVLPTIGNRKWAARQFQNFDYDIRDIAGMNFQAKHLDRRTFGELEKDKWLEIAEELRKSITDEDIREAVQLLPKPAIEMYGEEIESKLRSRRDKVVEFAERYYKYVAKELEIVGSHGDDLFVIDEIEDEKLLVIRYHGLEENPKNIMYKRVVHPAETKELRLYGIAGNNQFRFKNRKKLPVKVHVIGGAGDSEMVYTNLTPDSPKNVNVHTKDVRLKPLARIKPNMGEFTEESIDKYGYNYHEYRYDVTAPALAIGFSKDDGIFLGGGFVYTKYGFRDYPFSQQHRFTANVATQNRSFNFLYEGEFTQLIGYTDLLVIGDVQSPNFQTNFFGLGNETVRDRSRNFHNVRKDLYAIKTALRHRFSRRLQVRFGPLLEVVDVRESAGKFVATPEAGLDASDFSTFPILGFETTIQYNTTSNFLFPKNGIDLQLGGNLSYNFKDSDPLFKINASTSLYKTLSTINTTFATRAGLEANVGDYRFFQANTLGDAGVFINANRGIFDRATMRGMPRDRFSGRTAFYHNTEIRAKLFDVPSYIAPGELGIITLADHGRVWTSGENSSVWHYAWGGGLWYNFFERVLVSTTITTSDVDTSFSLLLGFMF